MNRKTFKKEKKDLIPERYGMTTCPLCGGAGKLFQESKKPTVCENCGGFGAVKSPDPYLRPCSSPALLVHDPESGEK